MKASPTEIPSAAKPATGEFPGQFDLDSTTDDMRAWDRAMEAEGLKITPDERKKLLKGEQDRLFKGDRW